MKITNRVLKYATITLCLCPLVLSILIYSYTYDLQNKLTSAQTNDESIAEIEQMKSQISELNATFLQLTLTYNNKTQYANNLELQIQDLLQELSISLQNSSNLAEANAEKEQQMIELQTMYNTLQDEFVGFLGITNQTFLTYLDKVAVINYTWSMSMSGLDRYYVAEIEFFNYDAPCNVSIKLYDPSGGVSYVVTRELPNGYKRLVENWGTGWATYNYPNIIIEKVER